MAHGPDNPDGPTRRAAFEELYARHGKEVWAVAYARRADADLAADIAQEAFLRLWKQWEAGPGTGGADEAIHHPRAWLLRVARNLAEDSAKSAFRRNGTQPPEVLSGLRADKPSPADVMEQQEQFARVRAELAELSDDDRQVLTLRYALDYDAAAIAEALGVNVAAVHMRLSRARARLADRLTRRGDFPPGGPPP